MPIVKSLSLTPDRISGLDFIILKKNENNLEKIFKFNNINSLFDQFYRLLFSKVFFFEYLLLQN